MCILKERVRGIRSEEETEENGVRHGVEQDEEEEERRWGGREGRRGYYARRYRSKMRQYEGSCRGSNSKHSTL